MYLNIGLKESYIKKICLFIDKYQLESETKSFISAYKDIKKRYNQNKKYLNKKYEELFTLEVQSPIVL